jgi:prepilin-type N-terminal cleavage/methylation domain-containing protein
MPNSRKRAFSLIEISVVIVIISIVIAGVVKGNSLLAKSRLVNAQYLTERSPIIDMPDLMVWYETSLESSFINTEEKDGLNISTWNDNRSNATTKNNATQTTSANQPTFHENIFNGAIPALRFNGSNSYLSFSGTPIVNGPYTIFIVEQKRVDPASGTSICLLGDDSTSLNLCYLNNGGTIEINQAHDSYKNYYDTALNYSQNPVARIHSFWFNTSGGDGSASNKKYWLNGGGASPDAISNASNINQATAITSFSNATIGRGLSSSSYFNGDIAEIIIFTRALKTEERNAIEGYLSKKYNIELS